MGDVTATTASWPGRRSDLASIGGRACRGRARFPGSFRAIDCRTCAEVSAQSGELTRVYAAVRSESASREDVEQRPVDTQMTIRSVSSGPASECYRRVLRLNTRDTQPRRAGKRRQRATRRPLVRSLAASSARIVGSSRDATASACRARNPALSVNLGSPCPSRTTSLPVCKQ